MNWWMVFLSKSVERLLWRWGMILMTEGIHSKTMQLFFELLEQKFHFCTRANYASDFCCNEKKKKKKKDKKQNCPTSLFHNILSIIQSIHLFEADYHPWAPKTSSREIWRTSNYDVPEGLKIWYRFTGMKIGEQLRIPRSPNYWEHNICISARRD